MTGPNIPEQLDLVELACKQEALLVEEIARAREFLGDLEARLAEVRVAKAALRG
jgi:hypothetical protein